MHVAVAVCVDAAAPLPACLAALDGQGADLIVRRSTSGIAEARNWALAECTADVIAFVDGDVVVGAEWLQALQAAWDEGGDDLGCCGGPISGLPSSRPVWLGEDGLLSAWGTIDLGPHARDVDPAEETFFAGNVSFRVDALRGVGGFWPARGRASVTDWFSEEHEAQRELARAGWRARWDPALAAHRVVVPGRRDLLRRRLAYGARLQQVGERRLPLAAIRAAAISGVGAAVAAVRGDEATATARAARAAENTGVLASGLLAHGDFQPVVSRTPFRASVPPPAPPPLRLRLRPRIPRGDRQGGVVLLYHRIAESESDAQNLCVRPAYFAAQMRVLAAGWDVVPLQDLLHGAAGPRSVSITFDDGYVDNLFEAAPLLSALRLPAMVFVTTGHVARGEPFWWDEVERLLTRETPPILVLAIDGQRRAWVTRTAAQREVACRHVHAWLAPMPTETIRTALNALRDWAADGAGGGAPTRRPVTLEELRRLAAIEVISIGGHTRDHPSLAAQPHGVQEREIIGCHEDVVRWLGHAPAGFSYPFGVPGVDFDTRTRQLTDKAGFAFAVTTRPGRVSTTTDRLAVPRQVVPDLDGEQFSAWLSSLTGAREKR
jgi:peptidoglycan/xylan/chitin deacetylase (PgdA/CDA1 family)